MQDNYKIIWAEGMFLGQQHFQQWESDLEARQRFMLEAIMPNSTGVKKLVIDETCLENGLVLIKQCQAIFPTGIFIDYDDQYFPTLTYQLPETMPVILEIFLGISIKDSVSGIAGYPALTGPYRWVGQYQKVADKFDPQREQEIFVAHPNLCILSNNEDRTNYYTIKILEISSEQLGRYQLEKSYIMPLLNIKASAYLNDLLRQLIELLISKIRLLRDRRIQNRGGITEFGHSDLAHFLLLELFSSFVPILQHFYQQRLSHPQQFYLTLIVFTGKLGAFSQSYDAASLPNYQHDNLRDTFGNLAILLKQLLESVIPSHMSELRLIRQNDRLYKIDSIDSALFTTSRFYLAVSLEATDIQWLDQVSRQVKVAASSQIETIVASALSGVKISHTHRPPNKLPVKTGYEYFYLEPSGQFWDKIITERTMAIFVSAEFVNAQIDLLTVQGV